MPPSLASALRLPFLPWDSEVDGKGMVQGIRKFERRNGCYLTSHLISEMANQLVVRHREQL